MGKILYTEVEVECDSLHCDECERCKLPETKQPQFDTAVQRIQEVFDEVGPCNDRGTDWRKCDQEPWWSLGREFSRFG